MNVPFFDLVAIRKRGRTSTAGYAGTPFRKLRARVLGAPHFGTGKIQQVVHLRPRGLGTLATSLILTLFSLDACRNREQSNTGSTDGFEPMYRPVEGRLSVFEKHVPFTLDGDLDPGARSEHARLELTVKRRFRDSRYPEGLAHLVWLDVTKTRYDHALERLGAIREEHKTATVLNDLAVVHLARASAGNNETEFFPALEYLHRVKAAAPDFLPASFNFALLMEKVHLHEEALAAWRDYLRLDPSSEWADEARQHLAGLQNFSNEPFTEADAAGLARAALAGDKGRTAKILRSFPGRTRGYWENELLPDWAEAEASGEKKAARQTLAIAKHIGSVLAEINGDYLLLDTHSAIQTPPEAGDPRERLFEGFKAFRKGLDHYRSLGYRTALTSFERSGELLRGHGPFAYLARYYSAVCHYQQKDFAEAGGVLRRLLAKLPPDRYPILKGRVLWMSGLIHLETGNPTKALDDYRQARSCFETGIEDDLRSRILIQLFDCHERLGKRDAMWSFGFEALAASSGLAPEQRYGIALEVAEKIFQEGHTLASLYFHNLAVKLAERSGVPSRCAEALWRRCRIHAAMGHSELASADLVRAGAYLQEIPEHFREIAELDYLAVEAELLLESDPAHAVELLRGPLEGFTQQERNIRLLALTFLKVLALKKMADYDSAEAALRQGIDNIEAQLAKIADPFDRVSYFDYQRKLFDEMILLQAEHRQDEERALEYSERGRARNLLEFVLADRSDREEARSSRPTPLPPETLKLRLGSSTAVIEYALIESRLFIWVIRDTGIDMVNRDLDSISLTGTIDTFLHGLSRGKGDEELAAKLFDLLVRPVKPFLQARDVLVFVPDKALYNIPFPALVDVETGRFLIEDQAIVVAPSAAIYLQSLERDAILADGKPSALLVGEAQIDRRAFPELTPTGEEVNTIASYYPEHELLSGGGASRSCFLEGAGQHSVVYFGGHALVNARLAPFSRLVLAADPDREDAGALHAHELYGHDFRRTRLVILAACGTGSGPISRSEGPLSLARPFLAGKVPAVIASLWNVDARRTGEFFTLFHHYLGLGFNPLEALRFTQRHGLSQVRPGTSRLGDWAAFQLIGGIADEHRKSS